MSESLREAVDGLVSFLHVEREERLRDKRQADDRIGRRSHPQRLGEFFLQRTLSTIPGYAGQWSKTVPDEFWIVDRGAAIVSCPCGGEPRVPFEGLSGCRCGRSFIFTGSYVHVHKAPAQGPAA